MDSPSAAAKRLPSYRRALRFFIFAAYSGLTSCIFVDTEDPFYRTLWVAEADPVSEIIVSFPEWQQEQINISDDMVYGPAAGGDEVEDSESGSTEDAGHYGDGTVTAGPESQSGTEGKTDDQATTGVLNEAYRETDGETGNGTDGKITIEFLCGNTVRVTATGATGTYGTYDTHGLTAYFSALRLTYIIGEIPVTVVFEEAHRTDDMLLVSWHYEGSGISYTTRLVRRSLYE